VRIAVVILLLLLAGGGLTGGILLITQPDGSALGLTLEMLPGWYPGDYLWAGLLLSIAFGIGPLIAAGLLLIRSRWGWPLVTVIGLALITWMLVQLAMIGLILPPMQLGFLGVGALLVGVGVWKSLTQGVQPN
jgi:hypothetical protein